MTRRVSSAVLFAMMFVWSQSGFAQSQPEAKGSGDTTQEHPLSFSIGGAQFTPGGFLDLTNIFRTTNTGNLGTNFFNIPFNNTVAAHTTEDKLTAQNSRLSLKVADSFKGNSVTGYVEMDFLGNDAANVNVTSNSHTMRMRLYFVDYRNGKFELQGGQMWGWLTPNRNGVSPYPSDLFYSLNEDYNYQVGLTWTRQPAVRFIYHPNDNLALGVSLENADQFGGQGEITFPSAFNAQMATQIDSATLSTTPNLFPDIVPKIAYDAHPGDKHMHVELAGLASGFKVTDLPELTGVVPFATHTKIGGGVSGAVNLEVAKGLHLVSNAFWSNGGGRYIFGMAPDLVIRPVNASGATCSATGGFASGCDVAISLVHSGSGIIGWEYQVTPKYNFFGYYGGMYAERNSFVDLTSTAATQPHIGFGGPNSANSNNRAIQEPTLGYIQTFWSHPQHGSLQLITQASYLTRSPWFVAAGAPKNAHLVMPWIDLRYVLP